MDIFNASAITVMQSDLLLLRLPSLKWQLTTVQCVFQYFRLMFGMESKQCHPHSNLIFALLSVSMSGNVRANLPIPS